MNPANLADSEFRRRVITGDLPPLGHKAQSSSLEKCDRLAIFQAQVTSRHADRVSRDMQARGEGFYTIGASGHEGTASIAWALRPTDPAFLHYRDGAFQLARSAQVPGQTPIWDMMLSYTTAREDPISGGRHKVLGSKALCIPPQTSTIASHLPKAVGCAYSIGLAKRTAPINQSFESDAIVVCSFGDASLNHSTAQGALNTASWTAFQSSPLPILFVCEDNGIGISVKTPKGWVAQSVANRPAIRYFSCDGTDFEDAFNVTQKAARYVRQCRAPAFLHVRCVRLFGHAGADAQTAYLSKEEIAAINNADPLLYSARLLIQSGDLDSDGVLALYDRVGKQIERVAALVAKRPKLSSAPEVMMSITPPHRELPVGNKESSQQTTLSSAEGRARAEPQPMARQINFAISDLMTSHSDIVLVGEDIGRKGGVYGVTQKLQAKFGPDRVVDSLLDEQAILGMAIGLAQNGFTPMPEIQFLAYLHNAEDQLRGEAATLSFFSNGQYTNPMVIRIAGLGYQRGFGGHFHNDNSIAVLRDIPGIILVCPSNGMDAVLLLREAVRLAREEQRVVIFLEPIALYGVRDLLTANDGAWLHKYPQEGAVIKFGEVGANGDGKDVLILSYANGYYLATQARHDLKSQHNIDARVVDIRWLCPLPEAAIIAEAATYQHILIVDECRRSGSPSEALIALLNEHYPAANLARLTAEDSFIPTGPAYNATLPRRETIVEAASRLLDRKRESDL